MDLREAYIRRKQENMALKRENASLLATVESLRKGTYLLLFTLFAASSSTDSQILCGKIP